MSAVFDYAQTAAEASESIAEYGAPMLLTQPSEGEYNAETSEVEAGTKKSDGFGVLIEYEARHIDGTNVLAGDVRILIAVHQRARSALNLAAMMPEPKPGDFVTLAPDTPLADTYRVVRPRTLKPGMVPVLFEVQARK